MSNLYRKGNQAVALNKVEINNTHNVPTRNKFAENRNLPQLQRGSTAPTTETKRRAGDHSPPRTTKVDHNIRIFQQSDQ